MLSIDSLLEQERAIPDKWNSEIQDNARLRIISELSAQSAFTEAENILYKLNFSDSKKEAEDIIANFRKDPGNLKIENYIKYAEVQMKTYLPESDGIKKRKNLSDLERYKEALKYIEDHINMMTISRNYQIKRKIGKINDEEMKIVLEKKLGLWQKNKKKVKIFVAKSGVYKNTSFYQTRIVKNLGK